ncbi:methionyl aminopeptidase [Fistulifera solaris]|uniref:Methionine aminopeptidase n=1 Tax=Fistulifera solaris TaxID=1519565 RepID=A0A1Z5JYI1_FISSO|nr:methionyl aminopeptidase [Fistulifera solaris]|eukprot:GAX19093.1 methionyl aminopeptidase [Fistulifera solaris]
MFFVTKAQTTRQAHLIHQFIRSLASSPATTHPFVRSPVQKYPLTPTRHVPSYIPRPPYARTGRVSPSVWLHQIALHTEDPVELRNAARLARRVLDLACASVQPGMTSDDIDAIVHETILRHGAYPSPLNYEGFPKSVCTSINEVICHGIPDLRPFQYGDVVSLDVSCYLQGVHGDNCATILVGDDEEGSDVQLAPARRLIQATKESLDAAIATCRPGSCLTSIGAAIQDVADSYGYHSVEKYRGHGIGTEFHCAPFVKHFRNHDYLRLQKGMVFTIEPMLTAGCADCFEWDDQWTVATSDGSLAAQFEHTVYITEDGAEILTLPDE